LPAVVAAAVVVLGMATATRPLHADVLLWDGNGASLPNPAGGSGVWSSTASNWWNGTANQAYNTGVAPHDAVFGVGGGTVNLSTPVTARSLRFEVGGYTLSGSGLTLSSAGNTGSTVCVTNSADTATIASAVSGSEGIVKAGDGKLVLSGNNSFAGLTIVDGVVSVSADPHLGGTAGAVVLDGGTLLVAGSSSLNAAATRNFAVGTSGGVFDIQNVSSTGLTITGVLSGTGALIKSGSGTLRLDARDNMFAGGITLRGGTLRFNNNNDAGPRALRLNRVAFAPAAGAATLSLGGSGDTDTGAPSELRSGEWASAAAGAGSIVAATTVTDQATGASGHDLLVFALADAVFSGAVSNLATSNGGVVGPNSRNGDLAVRGIATQTLSGAANVNSTVSVFSGAGLTLAGSAALTAPQIMLNLNGGTLALDNSATNRTDRLFDSAPVEPRGGGTLVLSGHAGGSSETLGTIQLGTGTPAAAPRSGALGIQVVHRAQDVAETVFTFAAIQRDTGCATVDFAARNGAGAAMPLGSGGNAPRILLTAPPALSATGLFSGPGGVGWATVNGFDFATYDSVTGVKAVSAVPFAFAGAADHALLAAIEVIASGSAKAVASLKISPSSPGLTLDLEGDASLQTPAVLLAGPQDFLVRNTAGGTGGLSATATQPQHIFVQQATLTIGVPITGAGALVKSGAGSVVLEGANTYAGPTTINEGVLRATPGAGLGPGPVELRGGVLEITGGGTFNRHLDYGAASGPGRISWSGVTGLPLPALRKEDRGSGGFAAVGADVRVDLNGLGRSDIVWEDPAFVATGYSLVLGSRNADALVELVDNYGLGLSPAAYNAREFRVIDNPNSTADVARISGTIFSDTVANRGMLNDLLKTGDGTLELTGDNTYIGGTIIAEGTLLVGHANALGRPGPGAYVLLGNRGGTTDAAMLTSTPLSVSRDIAVPAGGSGRVTLGTAVSGISQYTGTISIGTSGAAPARTVRLYAEAGSTVTFSGHIETARDAGPVTLDKDGLGTVILDAANSYHGDMLVTAGTLEIAHLHALPWGSGLSIDRGALAVLRSDLNIGGSAAAVSAVPVPEPSSLWLLTAGIMALLAARTWWNGRLCRKRNGVP
jgi:autotransporter-associated beta strand protein